MSIEFQNQASLRALNTFAMDVRARYYTELRALSDLPELLASAPFVQGPVLWLGGGSNILFCGDFPGLVVRVCLSGSRRLQTLDQHVLVEAAAGENWRQWVEYTLQQGWYGLENLSLIPGTVGACPVQNIGAYGVEVKDWISEVVCADLQQDGRQRVFSNSECQFAYRDSLFKHQDAGRYLVTAVRFKLARSPCLKTDYGDIRAELQRMNVGPEPSPLDVSHAVSQIRRNKLPDPQQLGNAGSFFKNPLLPNALAQSLQAQHPGLPCYPAGPDCSKLAAGWLIEQSGFKGYRINDAGVHERQALVLVNHGQATGAEIRDLSRQIQAAVQQRYGVTLETEPLMI